MKKLISLLLCLMLVFSGCASEEEATPTTTEFSGVCTAHVDSDDNGSCDNCEENLLVELNFYTINDLHGKITDGDSQPGVDELTTYLKKAKDKQENMMLLSAGDMWQGSSESNLTGGLLTTDWMNHVGFDAMVLGNHEFDWGESKVAANAELAEFPLLAINIYDRDTNQQAEYCESSVLVDHGEIQVGIIGAIGDCYSSISPEQVEGVYFKVGQELTELVKAESESLRAQGADFIVYVIHDGYEDSTSGSVTNIHGYEVDYYYDTALSNGYVDLVFEGHTHQRYILKDEYGVYHLQNKGENKGLSRIKAMVNTITGTTQIKQANLVPSGDYALLEDDPIVINLLDKYAEEVAPAMRVVGNNAQRRKSSQLQQYVADLYYQTGVKAWGDKYDIVLGGGFISVRSPYELPAGEVTYGQLQMLFPFDNDLVLCSVKGVDLKYNFFETDNSRYYISYGSYGENVWHNIDLDATYYIVVDSYSSQYAPNHLTEIERYTPGVYARDLLADFITAGGME